MKRRKRVHLVNQQHKQYIKGMHKFLAGLALALALSFAPIAQASAYQHSITIVTEDEENEGPENPEHLDKDSDDFQFAILGAVIVLGVAGVIIYRRFKR
jgi:F0F1-type ATP synthase membrane subunit c/vacuolar-type H+-ATPase subunit K